MAAGVKVEERGGLGCASMRDTWRFAPAAPGDGAAAPTVAGALAVTVMDEVDDVAAGVVVAAAAAASLAAPRARFAAMFERPRPRTAAVVVAVTAGFTLVETTDFARGVVAVALAEVVVVVGVAQAGGWSGLMVRDG